MQLGAMLPYDRTTVLGDNKYRKEQKWDIVRATILAKVSVASITDHGEDSKLFET